MVLFQHHLAMETNFAKLLVEVWTKLTARSVSSSYSWISARLNAQHPVLQLCPVCLFWMLESTVYPGSSCQFGVHVSETTSALIIQQMSIASCHYDLQAWASYFAGCWNATNIAVLSWRRITVQLHLVTTALQAHAVCGTWDWSMEHAWQNWLENQLETTDLVCMHLGVSP